MGILRPARALWTRCRAEGLATASRGLLEALSPASFCIYLLREPVPAVPLTYEVRSDLETLGRLRGAGPGLSQEFFRDAVGRAKRCYYAVIDNELAGIAWVLEPEYPSRFLDLAPGEIEFSNIVTVDKFRRRGVGKQIISHACIDLEATGTRTIYATIEETNLPSRAMFEALRFRQVATLRRGRVWGPRHRTPKVA